MFFELYDEDTAGWRPPCLGEPPVPQARVLRRTVEQNVDAVTFPTLDVPVPQMVDQQVDILKIIAQLSPAVEEQVGTWP